MIEMMLNDIEAPKTDMVGNAEARHAALPRYLSFFLGLVQHWSYLLVEVSVLSHVIGRQREKWKKKSICLPVKCPESCM